MLSADRKNGSKVQTEQSVTKFHTILGNEPKAPAKKANAQYKKYPKNIYRQIE